MSYSDAAPPEIRQMTVRMTDAELRAWKIAAASRGVSLSEWVRRVLNATAERTPIEA